MIRRFSMLAVTLLIAFQGFSQVNKYGVSAIKNYPHIITQGSEQNWTITQDHRGVIYVGNDDKGILEYDGSTWRRIPVSNNSIVRSLVTAEDGTVYVGAVSEIGFLAPDASGNLQYNSLLPVLDTTYHGFSDVWKSYYNDGNIYFYDIHWVLIYNIANNTFNVIHSYLHTLFSYFELGKLYGGAWVDGLVEMQGDTIVKSPGGEFYAGKDIFGLTEYDADHLLIGTPQDGLSLYNIHTGTVNPFGTNEVNEYVKANGVYHLQKLPTNEYLISSPAGGLALVSIDGNLKQIISKSEGLLDQTIYSSYINPNNYPYPPIWSALSLGVAKTDLISPLTSFTTEAGFQGLIADISALDDKLFLGTSTGLFSNVIVDGKSEFRQVGDINLAVWDFQNFTLRNGQEVILAITSEGVYQINKNGRTALLDKVIQNRRGVDALWGYTIIQNPDNPNHIILGQVNSIIYIEYKKGNWSETYNIEKLNGEVRTLAFDNKGNLWFGTPLAGIGRVNPDDTLTRPVYFGEEHGLPSLGENSVSRIGDELLVGTRDGIYRYNSNENLFEEDTVYRKYLPDGKNWVLAIHKDHEDCIWISLENSDLGWMVLYLQPQGDEYETIIKPFYSLPNLSSTDAFFSEENGSVWFPKSNVLHHYQKGYSMVDTSYQTLVRKVTIGADSVIFNGAYPRIKDENTYYVGTVQEKDLIPHIKHSENNIEFQWSAPYFDHEEELEYSYYLEGFSKSWSEWEKVVYQDFTNLPHGPYNFRIKAMNIYRDESLEDSFNFLILRPWYLTIVAFIGYVILAILIVYIIIVLYTRRLKNENIRLEGIIQERTAEIRKQKEELTDSIEYASRIQRAMLPPDKMLDKYELDHFILFRPRDIVSGDFYWIGVKEEKIFIVAADCTGHGVPGAFMSMLGISFLDEIVIKSGISETNEILDSLRQHVITSLRQTGKSMAESTKDGMDLAMISIDEKSKSIQYSGAYNPLYSVRKLNTQEKAILDKGEELPLERGDMHNGKHLLTQVKADMMTIGISEKDFNFSANTLSDVQSSTLYLFSDGYLDQFGGPNGKKFMAKNFKKLLLEIQDLSMEKQGDKLNQVLLKWMGEISQIDDVLVIGIKLGQ